MRQVEGGRGDRREEEVNARNQLGTKLSNQSKVSTTTLRHLPVTVAIT